MDKSKEKRRRGDAELGSARRRGSLFTRREGNAPASSGGPRTRSRAGPTSFGATGGGPDGVKGGERGHQGHSVAPLPGIPRR